MTPDPVKGATYIRYLDDARCDGLWHAVPELIRKVRKHAPSRSCLAAVAEVEYAINQAVASSISPYAAPDAPLEDSDLPEHLPRLLTAIETERDSFEDRFQAQVCAGWLHWVTGDPAPCLVHLPSQLQKACPNLDTTDRSSEWSNVCALKAAYIRSKCLARIRPSDDTDTPLAAYEAALPSLAGVWAGVPPRMQMRYWAELYLGEYCLLEGEALRCGKKSLQDPNTLDAFRSWARYWETVSAGVNPHAQGFKGARAVWNQYYGALSQLLERDLAPPPGHVTKATAAIVSTDPTPRALLRAELKSVEASFEALLLNETRFPRADEQASEVEAFVGLVVRNWSILGGRGWKEADLGPGGRIGLAKGVLDILYRATTKTFHSTAILRFLFLVHLSIAEFEMAFKSFDSWLAIINSAKARVNKTDHPEPGLDDDATMLETIAQCVVALCRFGERHAAERARDLGAELEDWLSRLPQLQKGAQVDGLVHPPIPSSTLALSWQAIGLSKAHWARVTYEASSRTEMQDKAIKCLSKSLSPEYGRSRDPTSLYALALLLAEKRELAAAIDLVKSALIVKASLPDESRDVLTGPHWRERSLVRLWHLLALLLSARQEHAVAARAAEGATEQFKDPAVLFGGSDLMFRSEHLNDMAKTGERRGLVDEMDDAEREGLLEVKMTQLALVEVLEGPDVAVNASYELLALYSRLFSRSSAPTTTTAAPSSSDGYSQASKNDIPPQSPVGTLRSIRGSIFGGSRRRQQQRQREAEQAREAEEERERVGRTPQLLSVSTAASSGAPSNPVSSTARPYTVQAGASLTPTIQITHEAGLRRRGSEDNNKMRRAASVGRRRSESSKRNSLRKRDRDGVGSRRRAASSGGAARRPTVVEGDVFFTPNPEEHLTNPLASASSTTLDARPSSRRSSLSKTSRSLMRLDSFRSRHSIDNEVYTGTATGTTPLESYTAPPAAPRLPSITLSPDTERKHRAGILVKVWLMIAGFYRRAEMRDEAKAAVAEARKVVENMEAEEERSVVKRVREWAVGKRVDELWADVWAELGNISLADKDAYAALDDFESALVYFPDHPSAIVGLSTILLDIYSQALLPPPALPTLAVAPVKPSLSSTIRSRPLGMGTDDPTPRQTSIHARPSIPPPTPPKSLPPAYKANSLPLVDRLAARDRATALLTGLTRLGSAWNLAEAWFALARAHEESGRVERAKEVLWWCVELEEGRGVRAWRDIGGYVLE